MSKYNLITDQYLIKCLNVLFNWRPGMLIYTKLAPSPIQSKSCDICVSPPKHNFQMSYYSHLQKSYDKKINYNMSS